MVSCKISYIQKHLLRRYVDPTIISTTPSQFTCLGKLTMQNYIYTFYIIITVHHPEGLTGPLIWGAVVTWLLPCKSQWFLSYFGAQKSQDTQRATEMYKIMDGIHEDLPCFHMFYLHQGLY